MSSGPRPQRAVGPRLERVLHDLGVGGRRLEGGEEVSDRRPTLGGDAVPEPLERAGPDPAARERGLAACLAMGAPPGN